LEISMESPIGSLNDMELPGLDINNNPSVHSTASIEKEIETAEEYLQLGNAQPGTNTLTGLPMPHKTQPTTLTDVGNAQRLVNLYGPDLRYCYERKKWLSWNSRYWEWDAGDKIIERAKDTIRSIYREAADEQDTANRTALVNHAKSSEREQRIKAMIKLAESIQDIPVKMQELDTDPWLFNCNNGTINLKTGFLQPHNKEDLITILVPIDYSPDAQSPVWDAFLMQVMKNDPEMVKYLQRLVGYSMTGDNSCQIVPFLYGLGRNGKTTALNCIRDMLGEYGTRVSTDVFMQLDKNFGGHKEGLANLRGKRFVVGSEINAERRLNAALIKDITGGETIKADRKYEHEVEYKPTYKVWFFGNHKPEIRDSTLGMWRRVKLIEFNFTVPEKEVDPYLELKLKAELPGILVWGVRGCTAWRLEGLAEPKKVTDATMNYRQEQDILADFIEDCCILEPSARVSKADLRWAYEKFCSNESSKPFSDKVFKSRLVDRGITDGHSGSIRWWNGIKLKSPALTGIWGQAGQQIHQSPT